MNYPVTDYVNKRRLRFREETPNLGFQYPLQTEQSYESATVGGHRTRATVKLIHHNIDYNTILIPRRYQESTRRRRGIVHPLAPSPHFHAYLPLLQTSTVTWRVFVRLSLYLSRADPSRKF